MLVLGAEMIRKGQTVRRVRRIGRAKSVRRVRRAKGRDDGIVTRPRMPLIPLRVEYKVKAAHNHDGVDGPRLGTTLLHAEEEE